MLAGIFIFENNFGLAAIFELNWRKLNPEAQRLAGFLSLFALAPIPWSLVEAAVSSIDLEFDLEASRTTLVQYSLLQELAKDLYQVHECIRELLQRKLEELTQADELKRKFYQAMVATAKNIPQNPTLREIDRVNFIVPHLAEAVTVRPGQFPSRSQS